MKWMKATVPDLRTPNDDDLRKLDPAHFCTGIQEGMLGRWGAVFKCGQSAEQLAGTRPGTARRLGKLTQAMPGRPDLAPQPRTEATFLTETPTP